MPVPSIFLSHNREDKPFARRLADDLRRASITVWLDEAEIRLGDSIIEKIEAGLHGSQYLGVILSPASVRSPWVKEELRAVLHQQITTRSRTVLPLLYRQCEIPAFLIDRLYADFTSPENYSFTLRQLLNRIDPSFVSPHFVSSEELQELLDRIPDPLERRSVFQPRTDEEDIEFASSNSIDLSELESKTPWPKPKLYSALRELIKTRRVELFLFKGVLDGGHAEIPAGASFVLPMIFKGSLPPKLRSSDEEIEEVLANLERG